MSNNVYKLDKLFKFVKSKASNIPNISNIIDEYESILSESLKKSDISPYSSIGQRYKRDIIMPDGEFYYVIFDIPTATKIIKRDNLIPDAILLSEIEQRIDVSNLDMSYLETAIDNKTPIIAVDYNPMNIHFVIDGNHRAFANKRFNVKGMTLCYNLNSKQLLECLSSDIFKNLYMVHNNIGLLLNHGINSLTNSKGKGALPIESLLLPLIK